MVCLRADPARSGAVVAILAGIAGVARYRVFHGPQDQREYLEDQLSEAGRAAPEDALADAVRNRAWLDAAGFRTRLTAERLKHPQADNIYALHAARVKHIPFQFKPLLRLLRADQPRLLIADDVGVGKTIEAGLILRELDARQRLDRVLIVCPKALVSKWRAEMRRFEEDFRPLTSETLRYCLRETELDGVWPAEYSRAIAHLELLRTDDVLRGTRGRRPVPGLLTLSSPPRFGLLVVDEAHHLRNPETNTHALARFLCDLAEAALFLSATPLHLGSQNLFTLLNLLRPDLFGDEGAFAQVIAPNRHVAAAIRHVRGRTPPDTWPREAGAAIDAAVATSWGGRALRTDPAVVSWRARLDAPLPLSDEERVRCVRDLEEVHSLAHVMNRTRRRDIGPFTIREPHTLAVPFTPPQALLYGELISFRRDVLTLQYDRRLVRLMTDTLERQAASCLPALAPAIEEMAREGRLVAEAELEDEVFPGDGPGSLPSELIGRAQELARLARELPPEDPKLERLRAVVQDAIGGSGPGKVLVFSFFLHTLAYLAEKLALENVRVAVVNGRVPDEERETLRARFRLPRAMPEAIDVLLSSEVGCEGLDYEFCDRLVNYDIPWNPMRIEQRIGRIDRFGQESPKILIYNMITPGTIEERIFFRCFDRLGIFRDTVGDHEEILGDLARELNATLMDPALTPEQAETRAAQLADNALRRVDEQRRLEAENGSLLGLDQAFTDEVDALIAAGRFVAPSALREMVGRYLESPELGGAIQKRAEQDGLFSIRLNREARARLSALVRGLRRRDRSTTSFLRWLEGDEPQLSVTFDQPVAVERREVAFVTPLHPLALLAVDALAGGAAALAAALTIEDPALPHGRHVFALELWETVAVRPEVRLVGLAWDIEAGREAPEIGTALIRLLERAHTAPAGATVAPAAIDRALRGLDEAAHARRASALAELRERNDGLAARTLASLDAFLGGDFAASMHKLSTAADDRIVRMKASERARVEHEWTLRRREVEARRAADIVTRRIAAGLLEVTHGD